MTRTYLITAASGIGAETARTLVRNSGSSQPVQVFLAARNEAQCRALAEELRALGGAAEYRAGDLTDPSFAPAVVRACMSAFRRLDALFNVAGISGRRFGDGPVHECTEEGWSLTLENNLTTQYRMCREGVRLMLKQPASDNGERGVILNMASVLAIAPEPRHFDAISYAASKGAIISMSRAMAACYAKQKIRVNVIAPGLVHTPMSARASEDTGIVEFMKIKQPLVEGTIPLEAVAASCAYLLTGASHAVTGQVLAVDAGWSVS
ncbi:MAG: SDR family oxidoreductase [Acidobacteria bacterium]|nr:SDR family oxidoreductase [Acidobacteriota bacterium]